MPKRGRGRRIAASAASVLVGAGIIAGGITEVIPRRSSGWGPTADATAMPPRAAESQEQQLERVAGIVAEVRDLPFTAIPEATYLTPEQLSTRIRDDSEVDVYVADAAERALVALGAIEPGTDLAELLVVTESEQIIGFYDPVTTELVVATSTRERLDPYDELTLAHELVHALTDQAIGFPALDVGGGAEDAELAVRSLVEGDASFATGLYAERALSAIDELRLGFGAGLAPEVTDDLPHYLVASGAFPYTEGASFVAALQGAGGWDAVDDAYRSPPVTTAQILFPERYGDGEEARSPMATAGLTAPWRLRHTFAVGAADLLWLFQAPGDDVTQALADPYRAARAWAGGVLHVWGHGRRTAIALLLVQHDEATGLCASVEQWYRRAAPGESVATESGEWMAVDGERKDAVLRCDGADVQLGIGADVDTARSVIALEER